MQILEFCFRDIWTYLGITIWLVIIFGYFHRNVLPKIKNSYAKFKNIFKKELDKNLGKTKI